ncbi:MAG: hypothetical protein WCT23_05890 [Candidatus Neomarinimicrobiota bacterium]
MKNELEHIIKKHFSENQNEVNFDPSDEISKDTLSVICDFLKILKPYDRPDMYANIDNDLLFIEHFEFDASAWNRKGSLEKKEIYRIDEREKEFFDNKQESCSFSDHINNKASLKNLIQNINDVFINHIKKIPDYIEHLKIDKLIDPKTKVRKCFFIESSSPFPCYINTENGSKIFNLFYADFFIQILKIYKNEIDYLFYSYAGNKEDILYFMDIRALSIYEDKCLKIDEKSFIPIDPHVISSRIFVKEEVRFGITDIHKDE